MPPSALLAMVGPRVANHVLHTLHDAFPDRFPLSPTLENFANGEMDIVLTGDARQTVDEIYEAILEALADEARHLLDEGVVASAAEIDACLILGAGFPFFRGGLTKYLDQEGVSSRVSGTASSGRGVENPPSSDGVPVQFRPTAPLDAPETRECADPQGKQHLSRVLRICTRPTSTRHIRRRSRQRAWKPPRSALRPGTASRSSTPVRTPLPPSLPAPRAAVLSTTPSPRWTQGRRDSVDALARALRAHARPRARARVADAADGRRHRAAPPPGRRARRHADRADRGEPARPRTRTGTGTGTETPPSAGRDAGESAELDEEDDDFDAGVVDDDAPTSRRSPARIPAPHGATASATRLLPGRRSPRPGSSSRPATSAS